MDEKQRQQKLLILPQFDGGWARDKMEGKSIHNIAIDETYHDGQIIFEEGSSGDWVYIIQSGSVEISKMVNNIIDRHSYLLFT